MPTGCLIATRAQAIMPSLPETLQHNAVDELVQSLVGDTGIGVRMPIPKDPFKNETNMLMSIPRML
jgi:hypothetical protein